MTPFDFSLLCDQSGHGFGQGGGISKGDADGANQYEGLCFCDRSRFGDGSGSTYGKGEGWGSGDGYYRGYVGGTVNSSGIEPGEGDGSGDCYGYG